MDLPKKPGVAGSIRVPTLDPKVEPEKPLPTMPELDPGLPWYKKHGLKRAVGLALSSVGGTLIFSGQVLVGAVVLGVGAFLGAVGVVHAQEKKEKGVDQSDSVGHAISTWLVATYNLIRCLRTKK